MNKQLNSATGAATRRKRSVSQCFPRVNEWNENPKPFAWTKTADGILEALAAYCTGLPAQDARARPVTVGRGGA